MSAFDIDLVELTIAAGSNSCIWIFVSEKYCLFEITEVMINFLDVIPGKAGIW